MQARKSLQLPRPGDLQSMKLPDLQKYFGRLQEELDKQYRLMFQDINTIQVDIDNYIYFGGKNTEGSWRQGRDGDNFVTQRFEDVLGTLTWVTKDTIVP